MKKSNLIYGIICVLAGVLFLAAALFLDTPFGSQLCGYAGAGLGIGAVTIWKYLYWNRPRNRARYQERLEAERIELHDEMKERLREKSGRYAYLAGIVVICLSMGLFSILDTLDFPISGNFIVLFLGSYLIFQVAAGILFFKLLLRKYCP